MRILHLNERAGVYGGVEQILRDMALGLAAAGHPQALLHDDPRPQADFLNAFEDCAGPFEPYARPMAQLERSIARFRPDVLLIHKLDDTGVVAAASRLVPTARMIHDHDLVCLRRHKYFPIGHRICDKPAGMACYRHLCFIQRAKPGARLPVHLALVSTRRQAIAAHRDVRRFIVGSRWMRDELTMNGIDPARVEVLPPVPMALSKTSALAPSREPEVLFVGQVIRGKGVDLMLRALASVPPPWHATIVGTGNHLDTCKALASELGLAEQVEFAGWIDHSRLEQYYARAALSLVPSRWPEPFGMVGIEAMARGRPVVAFDAGGIPDWLDDGVTGLLAPQADVQTLGAHITRLLADPDLAARLGRQAATRVSERFRSDLFLRNLAAVLADTAAAR